MITVLTVDDEILIKRTLKKLIEYEGSPFQVIGEAEDGEEALSLIRAYRPDLVITDIRMPVMDGLELAREGLAVRPDTSFVILSGHDDFAYAQQALRCNVTDYLLKPLKPDQLREVLAKVQMRLNARTEAERERLHLLWFCKSRAEPLADSIWLLNEEMTAALLAEIKEAFSPSRDEAVLRAHYLTLLTLMDGALAEKSGGTIRVAPATLAHFPEDAGRMHEALGSECARAAEQIRQSRNWLSHQNMKKAASYLQQHFAKETLSLQEVADVVGISPSYFSRMFKEEHGISFIHYLTKLRMQRACELLADPQCRTYEAAYAAGYTDYPHFTKVFKKMYGVSPSDYRKRIEADFIR